MPTDSSPLRCARSIIAALTILIRLAVLAAALSPALGIAQTNCSIVGSWQGRPSGGTAGVTSSFTFNEDLTGKYLSTPFCTRESDVTATRTVDPLGSTAYTVAGAGSGETGCLGFTARWSFAGGSFGNPCGTAAVTFSFSDGTRRTDIASGGGGSSHDEEATGSDDADGCPKPEGGCTTWTVAPMTVSLMLQDQPVGYQPPRGPSVQVLIQYAHRDVQQPAVFNYGNFGRQWTSNWISYVIDELATRAQARVYLRGGGGETHAFGVTSGVTSLLNPYSQTVLTRQVDGARRTVGFTRHQRDGSKEEFGFAAGTTFFLTAIVDPHGNRVALGYDGQARLTSITDAIGQITRVSYGHADPLKITQITDPFGRSALFTYNAAGLLESITDTIGITSSFAYGPGNFVNTLTTPYGTTRFSFGDASLTPGLGTTRFLVITDALGRTKRYEYNDAAPGIAASESAAPTGMTVDNRELNRRNTFIWNPVQYAEATRGGGLDYTKAKIIHWLRLPSGGASRVPASIKEPLEGRVWFQYAGQPDGATQGSSDQPIRVGRVLGDGTTQLEAFSYNSFGNITSRTDPLGRRTEFAYAGNGIDLLSVTNTTVGPQVLSAFTYNAQHLPLTATGANGVSTSFSYNPSGQLLSRTDALGNTTSYGYDGNGYLTSLQGAIPTALQRFTYDAAGRVATATDAGGTTITYTYDAADRRLSATYPDGTSIRYTYNLLDLATITDRLGRTTTLTYDTERALIRRTNPLGHSVQFGYSGAGGMTSLTDENGRTTTWLRDLQDRTTRKVFADNSAHAFSYEPGTSRVVGVTDARGQTTQTIYNADNTVSAVNYLNAVIPTPSVRYSYDTTHARLLSMTDGTGTTSYTYHPVGALGANQLHSVSSPSPGSTVGNLVVYRYDALDRVIGRIVNGSEDTTAFDPLGRVTAKANALDGFSYAYSDGTDRVTAISSTRGPRITLDYFGPERDQLLRTMTYTSASGPLLSRYGYTYDANQNVATFSEAFPGQQLAHARTERRMALGGPDKAKLIGSLVAMAEQETPSTKPATQSARRSASGFGSGSFLFGAIFLPVMWRWSRSRKGWGAAIAVIAALSIGSCGGGGGDNSSGGGNTVADPATVSAGTPTAEVTYYTYDAADRLIAAAVGTDVRVPDGPPRSAYAYDPASNPTLYTTNGGTRSLQYTSTNGIAGIRYDLNGNPEGAFDGRAYRWDAADRLVAITRGDSTTSFTYDGQSRLVRIVETVAGAVTSDKAHLWCALERCAERDNLAAGAPVTKRYFDQGVVAGGEGQYYVRDQLGSVRQAVDGGGTVQAHYAFDPYGHRSKIRGTAEVDAGFTGHFQHGPSGLALAPYRAYDSSFGRWLNRDPIAESGGVNLYAYVGGNPASALDPTGQYGKQVVSTIYGGVTGAVTAVSAGYALAQATGQCYDFYDGVRDAAIGAVVGATAGLLGNAAARWIFPASKSLGANPFKGKTAKEAAEMLEKKGYVPRGPDPAAGRGTYVNPQTGRGYHIDGDHPSPKGPHVGVHRPRDMRGAFSPRDYPLKGPQ